MAKRRGLFFEKTVLAFAKAAVKAAAIGRGIRVLSENERLLEAAC
jgi:hypothetical protein